MARPKGGKGVRRGPSGPHSLVGPLEGSCASTKGQMQSYHAKVICHQCRRDDMGGGCYAILIVLFIAAERPGPRARPLPSPIILSLHCWRHVVVDAVVRSRMDRFRKRKAHIKWTPGPPLSQQAPRFPLSLFHATSPFNRHRSWPVLPVLPAKSRPVSSPRL